MNRTFRSDDYNWNFNTETGRFERWGKTQDDDPLYSTIGPEIADIEITTICNGIDGTPCKFCYKSNTSVGHNMTFETFKRVFDKLPSNLTQIAFGVDAKCESNPDTFKIMKYCRDNNVIPNVTVANVTKEVASKLSELCGAVAVSRYTNDKIFYDTITNLKHSGIRQLNVHVLISTETISLVKQTYDDYINGVLPVHAIVGLSLKQGGRGRAYRPLEQKEFDSLVKYALYNGVPIGFDSCSAPKFVKSTGDRFITYVEPCESTLFSAYINVHGDFFPCSFTEGVYNNKGISILEAKDFLGGVWNSKSACNFRDMVLHNVDNNGIRMCPFYKV